MWQGAVGGQMPFGGEGVSVETADFSLLTRAAFVSGSGEVFWKPRHEHGLNSDL